MNNIAEQFGTTVMQKKALRNADNHLTLGDVTDEVYPSHL